MPRVEPNKFGFEALAEDVEVDNQQKFLQNRAVANKTGYPYPKTRTSDQINNPFDKPEEVPQTLKDMVKKRAKIKVQGAP